MKSILTSLLSLTLGLHVFAQNHTPASLEALKKETGRSIQSGYDSYKSIALSIWDYAEVGFKEQKSSALLQKTLTENGFTVEAGIAGMPT